MRPQVVTKAASGTTAWIPVDMYQTPFNLSFAVVLTGATLTYSVEYTLDDVYDSTITPTAFAHADVAAETTSQSGNIAFPVRAVRLNITAYTAGSATMTILQGRK
jgi:hypothetical protein